MAKVIHFLTSIGKYLSIIGLVFISIFTFIAVVMRFFNHPIAGDVELVQFSMVVVIMGGLAYAQEKDSHIAVDILFNKFPGIVQGILDLFTKLLTIIASFIIAYIYFFVFLKHMNEMILKSTLFQIVYYPFDFIIVIGFFTWGLQAILQFVVQFKKLIRKDW